MNLTGWLETITVTCESLREWFKQQGGYTVEGIRRTQATSENTGIIRGRKGFTLVELLVVMAILAMLAALVGPKLFPKLGKGKQSAAKAQIELLGQALDQFKLDTGRYPTTQEGLDALMNNPGVDNWEGSYLKKSLPSDPWNKPYIYTSPGTHNEYDLSSNGRDGTPGGEGEDKDVTSWE
jgi:general secretion pathway protein G